MEPGKVDKVLSNKKMQQSCRVLHSVALSCQMQDGKETRTVNLLQITVKSFYLSSLYQR